MKRWFELLFYFFRCIYGSHSVNTKLWCKSGLYMWCGSEVFKVCWIIWGVLHGTGGGFVEFSVSFQSCRYSTDRDINNCCLFMLSRLLESTLRQYNPIKSQETERTISSHTLRTKTYKKTGWLASQPQLLHKSSHVSLDHRKRSSLSKTRPVLTSN